MTISQMRHFQAVCQYKNVTKAAESLHITQPSVSSSIRELEAELGVNLFHRTHKRLALTREGEFFLERAGRILEQVDTLTRHMQDFAGGKNKIRVGVPPMIGTFLFPALFDRFHEAHPEVEVEIEEHGSVRINELVKSDDLDIALAIADRGHAPELHTIPILRTALEFCVSSSHPLAGLETMDLAQLADQQLVLFKGDFFQNNFLLEQFASLGIEPQVILSSGQLYTIKKVVAQGKAGAFLFREIAAMEPDLVGIPLRKPVEVDICLIWKKGRHVYSDTARFIRFIRQHYGRD